MNGNCNSSSNLVYSSGYSAFNPFGLNTATYINPTTGQIFFTPTALGKFQLAVEVDEYRNGHKIGSIVDDFQVFVQAGIFGQPSLSAANVSGGQFTSSLDTILTSCGNHLSFNVVAQATPASDSLYLTGGGFNAAPGSSYVVTGIDTGLFSWTPGLSDIGYHLVSFSAVDSSCSSNFGITSRILNLVIGVSAPSNVLITANLVPQIGFSPNPSSGVFTMSCNSTTAVKRLS